MSYNSIDIKEGIKFHKIKTNKFKTNLIAVFLTTKLSREKVTKNALIPSVLKRGSTKFQTQDLISKELEEMYGADFGCGIDKTGDNQILKFFIETINQEFAIDNNMDLLKDGISNILDIIFNPYLENGVFKKEYVDQEKQNLKSVIDSKIDNKSKYAVQRCVEEMYKDKPYGLFQFGYVEDLENINEENLKNAYDELINNCKIDIFVSTDSEEEIFEIIKNNESIQLLKDRDAKYNEIDDLNKEKQEEKIVEESKEVAQGKLVLGLDVILDDNEKRYSTSVYNAILGGSANSKMFQNVREKENLAYVASSSYVRQKNNIIINTGIEIKNYKKALEVIRVQLDDMENGNFSDEDIENAKKSIISGVRVIKEEQDTELTYYFGQEISKSKIEIDEYISKVEKVSKEDIVNIANNININTVYFLKS